MAIEAPYRGRDEVPAQADKTSAVPADKPEAEVDSPVTTTIEADKANAPAEEIEAEEEVTGEEVAAEEEEDESTEVPDPNLILMRADYQRKTAALAREKEQLARENAERAEKYGVYEQVDALLASNPGLAKTHTIEQIAAMIRGEGPAPVTSAVPPEARREIESMRREIAETKESLFADRVESSVKRVAKQYGLKKAQVEQLVHYAVEDEQIVPGMPADRINQRLTLIARGMTYKDAEAKGQSKLVTKLKEQGRAATGGRAGTPTSVEASTPRVKGWDNLVKQFTAKAKS